MAKHEITITMTFEVEAEDSETLDAEDVAGEQFHEWIMKQVESTDEISLIEWEYPDE